MLRVFCAVVFAMASEVLKASRPQLEAFEKELPPGYSMEIVGEGKQQADSFGQLGVVMVVSILAIFGALVLQFNNAVKPLIVFAAIPYGFVGAFASLWVPWTRPSGSWPFWAWPA